MRILSAWKRGEAENNQKYKELVFEIKYWLFKK